MIPRTEHSFGEWHDEVSPTCHKDGTKGYYECSHCEKKFDIDYREITDLTLPAGHSPGKLIPASQGKCNEPDILVAYYQCERCGSFLDEALNELAYNGIFLYADRHNYTYSPEGIWGHRCKCLDCGAEATEPHTPTYSFYTEGGKHLKKAVCDFCGYEEEPMTYRPVSGIEMMSDLYVGYNERDYVFRIFYRDGGDTTQCARNVMSSEEYLRYEALLKSLGKDFTPFTETLTVTYDDYTAQIDITFHPYILYGVVTADKVYQKGFLSDLYAIRFIYDCNYTRGTGEPVIVHGEITDNDGFDSDFDFAAAGTDTKIYTIRYRIDGTEYEVTVTYVNTVTPLRLAVHEDRVMCGEWPLIVVYCSDDTFDSSPLTPAMITGGSFDPAVFGKQTFTVTTEGITETFTVTVRDPQEIDFFYLDKSTINLGEKLYLRIRRCNGLYETIECAPDMISGTFDPDTAGTYEITITCGGKLSFATVRVIDRDDTRVDSISTIYQDNLVWDIKDGNVVPDLEYLYIEVRRKNDTRAYLKVAEEMLSYDPLAAAEAIANGGTFTVTISYYGKVTYAAVAPREIASLSVTEIAVYDRENLSYGETTSLYRQDGDLSRYFVRLRTSDGSRFLPLAESMFYVKGGDDTLSPFDVENAENNKAHSVVLQYGNAKRDYITLLVFSESDIEYSFSIEYYGELTVGTKEEVLAQLAGKRFYLNMHVCHYSTSLGTFTFEDLILAPTDDIDFSQPGTVRLTVSYKGIVDAISITLVPDLRDVRKTSYQTDDGVLELYENGYARLGGYAYGTYRFVNEALGLYQLVFYNRDGSLFFTIDGERAVGFRAEMLGGVLEEYSMFGFDGLFSVKIYTKDGFSMADMYNENGDYDYSVIVTFAADGSLLIHSVRYTIKDNALLEIVAEGEVVYRYFEADEDYYIRGTLNDNGMFYLYMGQEDGDGNIVEYSVVAYRWDEKDGVVTIYDETGYQMIQGTINGDGYLVLSIL